MRINILIPDDFHNKIKENLNTWGYLTINDFVLDCIRQRQRDIETMQSPLMEVIEEATVSDPSLSSAPVETVVQNEEQKKIICHECKQEAAGIEGLSVHMANVHGRFYSATELILIQQLQTNKSNQSTQITPPEIQEQIIQQSMGEACKQCGKNNQGRSTCPHCGFMNV